MLVNENHIGKIIYFSIINPFNPSSIHELYVQKQAIILGILDRKVVFYFLQKPRYDNNSSIEYQASVFHFHFIDGEIHYKRNEISKKHYLRFTSKPFTEYFQNSIEPLIKHSIDYCTIHRIELPYCIQIVNIDELFYCE